MLRIPRGRSLDLRFVDVEGLSVKEELEVRLMVPLGFPFPASLRSDAEGELRLGGLPSERTSCCVSITRDGRSRCRARTTEKVEPPRWGVASRSTRDRMSRSL